MDTPRLPYTELVDSRFLAEPLHPVITSNDGDTAGNAVTKPSSEIPKPEEPSKPDAGPMATAATVESKPEPARAGDTKPEARQQTTADEARHTEAKPDKDSGSDQGREAKNETAQTVKPTNRAEIPKPEEPSKPDAGPMATAATVESKPEPARAGDTKPEARQQTTADEARHTEAKPDKDSGSDQGREAKNETAQTVKPTNRAEIPKPEEPRQDIGDRADTSRIPDTGTETIEVREGNVGRGEQTPVPWAFDSLDDIGEIGQSSGQGGPEIETSKVYQGGESPNTRTGASASQGNSGDQLVYTESDTPGMIYEIGPDGNFRLVPDGSTPYWAPDNQTRPNSTYGPGVTNSTRPTSTALVRSRDSVRDPNALTPAEVIRNLVSVYGHGTVDFLLSLGRSMQSMVRQSTDRWLDKRDRDPRPSALQIASRAGKSRLRRELEEQEKVDRRFHRHVLPTPLTTVPRRHAIDRGPWNGEETRTQNNQHKKMLS
jgi:hypothetical protein